MFLSVLQPFDHRFIKMWGSHRQEFCQCTGRSSKRAPISPGWKVQNSYFFVWWFPESNFNLVLPYQSFLSTSFDIHSLSSRHHYHHCWNMKNKCVLVYCINYGNCFICKQVHNYLSYFKHGNQINMTWLKVIIKKLNSVNHVKSNTSTLFFFVLTREF